VQKAKGRGVRKEKKIGKQDKKQNGNKKKGKIKIYIF